MNAIVKLDSVYQHIQGRCVLENINLSIQHGEAFALLGPNGSGKTRLLRLIMGLDRASAGSIEVLGHDIARLSFAKMQALRASLGMVFQGGSLLHDLSVVENLILPLQQSRHSAAALQRAARLIMTQLRLDGLENLRPYELSGGLMRKVELARALIRRPALLLWDELLDELDPASLCELREHLRQENQTREMTLLFTSHQVTNAISIAHRIGVLANGRMLFTGTEKDLQQAKQHNLEIRYVVDGQP